jgi:hypothetical protein
MFSNFFLKLMPFMRKCGKLWYSQAGYRSKYNMTWRGCDFHAG